MQLGGYRGAVGTGMLSS